MDSRPLWTRSLSQEFWSGGVTFLMFSLAGGLIEERMARRGLRIAGLKHLGKEPFLRLHAGHVYVNSRILEEVVKRIPSVLVTPELLGFLPAGVRDRVSRARVSFFSPRTVGMLLRIIALEKDWAPFSNYRAFDKIAGKIEQDGRLLRLRPAQGLSDSRLLDRSRMLYEEMGEFLEVVTWGMVFAYVTRPLTERLAREWGRDSRGELAACLRVGLDGIKTFQINREIEVLSKEIADDPGLDAMCAGSEPAALLDALRKEGSATGFLKKFDAFIERHGHRFLERDIVHPTWRECPEAVIELIRANLTRDLCRRRLEGQERRAGAERLLMERVRRGPLGPLRRALFAWLLRYDRKYLMVRENMRYLAEIYLEQFRGLYLEIGRRWQSKGLLREPDEIFFLSREEIEQTHEKGSDVSTLIEVRKNEYRGFLHIRTPETLREGEKSACVFFPPEEKRFVLKGEVASPGHVTGPARIIREYVDLKGFRKGDILVARCTDPSWAPLLPLAAGLVLEVGGLLSHGSIVAREYGIPALIQAEGALESLRDGDRLELDTDEKCVRVIPDPGPLDNRKQFA